MIAVRFFSMEMEEAKLNFFFKCIVLSADESSLIAMQLNMNPIVDARQSFDIYPR